MIRVIVLALLAIVCWTNATAKAAKAEKYLELIFVEQPGEDSGSGSGPRDSETITKLLNDPKNKVTPLAHAALKNGRFSLKGVGPAVMDVGVSGDWNSSLKTPQAVYLQIEDKTIRSANGAIDHWQASFDTLSEEKPLVIFRPWTLSSHVTVVIRIVDNPLTK